MKLTRILFVGSSQLKFAESPDVGRLPDLTCACLREMGFSDLEEPSVALAYPLANMRDQVVKAVKAANPDFVVLFLGSSTFAEHKVEYALRRRSRSLWRLARPLTSSLLRLAGGGTEGSRSARGLLFRLPRSVAGRAFGVAPRVSPQTAITSVKSTIEDLRARVDGNCLVILSTGAPQTRERSDEARDIIEHFNSAVSTWCDEVGVSHFDPIRRLQENEIAFSRVDGIHADSATRKALGLVIADEVAALMRRREAVARPTSVVAD